MSLKTKLLLVAIVATLVVACLCDVIPEPPTANAAPVECTLLPWERAVEIDPTAPTACVLADGGTGPIGNAVIGGPRPVGCHYERGVAVPDTGGPQYVRGQPVRNVGRWFAYYRPVRRTVGWAVFGWRYCCR